MSIQDSRADRLAFALKYGYDRIGIHYSYYRPHLACACTCCWGSAAHGDNCPKHGTIGESIESEVNVLCRRVMELEAERDALLLRIERDRQAYDTQLAGMERLAELNHELKQKTREAEAERDAILAKVTKGGSR